MKTVFMGEWVRSAFLLDEDQETQEATDLLAYLNSQADEFGLQEFLLKDEDGEFYPAEGVDEEIFNSLDRYDAFTFWSIFSDRLGFTELMDEFAEELLELQEHEQIQDLLPIISKYEAIYQNRIFEEE